MKIKLLLLLSITLTLSFCAKEEPLERFTGAENEVRLMTVNPGHFHSFLIHRQDYHQIDPEAYVYAPEGSEVEIHTDRVASFNNQEVNPTSWKLNVYTGDDYLEQMLAEKPGNVMVVAGNNQYKINYIHRAVENGINVLSDKPMIIHHDSFPLLKESLELADEQGLVVNDMMTERYEITSILQKKLSHIPELFGELTKGSPEEPAIVKESVHFFYKTVAGAPLIRPPWFFDVSQQGESIVDVSTHLVDLIMLQAFPYDPIDYRNPDDGVEVVSARSWSTELTPDQFELITNTPAFPDYISSDLDENSVLHVAANGEFVFKFRDVYARAAALWGFTNPDGGDTHYSIIRGTKANLIVHQDLEQDFKATLYVEPTEAADVENFEAILDNALESLSGQYSGLAKEWTDLGWEIQIPDRYVETHEEHFGRVTMRFLDALVDGEIPEWERTNLLTKYFITTRAYEMSR